MTRELLLYSWMNTKVNDRVKNTVHVVQRDCKDLSNFIRHVEMKGNHEDLRDTDNHASSNDACCCDDDFGQLYLASDDDGNDEGVEGDEEDEWRYEEKDAFIGVTLLVYTSVVLLLIHYLKKVLVASFRHRHF